jgi:hypothetical protein
MSNPKFIGPVLGSTTPDPGESRFRVRSLPQDLLVQASRRLGILSLVASLLWLLGTLFYHLALLTLPETGVRWFEFTFSDGVCVVAMVGSLGLYRYTRGENRDPRFVLDVGLAYMVLTAVALSTILYLDPLWINLPTIPTISWVGAIILMFAAIVPNSPRKTLVAGLIAASMNPLALFYARTQDHWQGGLAGILVKHYPDFLLVGVSAVISHVVTGLGRQVTKAREMGSYRLVTLLGKGGMGEVWRASHRMLARDAAVKLIDPSMLSRRSGESAGLIQRRFEQEAKATASLRSPHTVELYDYGITEQGVFYYAMEYLDGVDLQTLVKKFGPQDPRRVAYILLQVCRSLGEAHLRGMVHRDIKPTNIFLCRMGGEHDFVKVLDFGLVKLDNSDVKMTQEGSTMGTPAFMAPELALGKAGVDGRTDLYGLGCVAYWLITGRLVFEETNPTVMMMAHLQKTPAPPSARSEYLVPPSLDQAILMCLSKEPEGRPASAATLARLLEQDEALMRWTREDAQRWWQTNIPGGTPFQAGTNDLESTASVT